MDSFNALPVATILVVILALVGGAAVLTGDELTFKEYMESITVGGAGLAVGRGLAVRRTR